MRLAALGLLLVAGAVVAEPWLTLAPGDRPITVSASGFVASAGAMRFGPPPSQEFRLTIMELAREGARVDAGDVLARFDASRADDRARTLSADLNAKRSELESLLETQAREIEEEKVLLAEARSAADKAARKADVDAEVYASLEYRKLLEDRRIAADLYEREKARRALTEQVRASRRAELEADIRRLESELAGAQRELASFTLKAPRPGLVIVGTDREGRKLDANDAVNPGMIVVELANLDDLVVQAEVPEYAATRIAVGQPAEVVIDAAGGNPIAGEVVEVASLVRRQSQYSQAMVRDVTVALPEAALAELRPGMSAKVEIEIAVRTDALAVPDDAIRYRDGRPGLLVRSDGWQAVTLGPASRGLRIVESGVDAGMEVQL